jgi:signal transduction histidine kinase
LASSRPVVASGAFVGAALFAPVATLIAAFAAMVRTGFHERERAIKARDEFISIASHELRTPIASLTLVAANLRRRQEQGDPGADPEVLMRYLGSLQRQTSRLTALVENLLDVSRISSGRMHFDLREVDLAEVVREVVGRFEAELRDTPAKLNVIAPAAVVGRWDETRLDQVVTNLVSNAVKYGERQPIDVSVRSSGTDAILAVTDHGPGIAAEDQARLFGRFERGASAIGRGGFGLGLWIVREIVTALDGKVGVESAPGRGATFTVVLPRAGPP